MSGADRARTRSASSRTRAPSRTPEEGSAKTFCSARCGVEPLRRRAGPGSSSTRVPPSAVGGLEYDRKPEGTPFVGRSPAWEILSADDGLPRYEIRADDLEMAARIVLDDRLRGRGRRDRLARATRSASPTPRATALRHGREGRRGIAELADAGGEIEMLADTEPRLPELLTTYQPDEGSAKTSARAVARQSAVRRRLAGRVGRRSRQRGSTPAPTPIAEASEQKPEFATTIVRSVAVWAADAARRRAAAVEMQST